MARAVCRRRTGRRPDTRQTAGSPLPNLTDTGLRPDPALENALAVALEHHRQGRLAAAESGYRQLLALAPDHPDALHLLGVLALQLGRPAVALELIGRAIALRPAAAMFHGNLASAHQALGQVAAAEASYCRALQLDPSYADAHSNLGNLLQRRGDLAGAIASYRRAVALDSRHADALSNLGQALRERGELAAAAVTCRQALAANPAHPQAWNNLGNALLAAGQQAEAIASYRQALQHQPDYAAAADNLLLGLLYLDGLPPSEQLAEYRRWGRVRPLSGSIERLSFPNRPDPDRRLRIGYVSGDLRAHAVAYAFLPLLANHDRRQFEVFLYFTSARHDALTDHFRTLADGWREIVNLSDEAVVDQIRADSIDLLVDLSGHTAGNRLGVFAQRTAPVQVSHAVVSTGLPTVDYLISDHHLAPNLDPASLAEALLRLPGCYTCYAPPPEAPPVAPLPTLSGTAPFTFGSFNNLAKLTPRVVALWSELLRQVPGSRLLLKGSQPLDPPTSAMIRARFAAAGVAPERIEVAPPTAGLVEHLALYGQVDVGLDPFPFNGFTTTCEALWMGVPVVTLAGQLFADRAGVTLLQAAGLPELIATSEADYLAIVTALAADLPTLAALRVSLRPRLAQSQLCDGPAYARSVETALRACWRRWCDSVLTAG